MASDPEQVAEGAWRLVVAKAWKDPAFKRQLVNDPRGVLQREFGVELPPEVNIRVIEDTRETIHVVLPVLPDDVEGSAPSDAELEQVTGFAPSNTNVMSGCSCCSSPCRKLDRWRYVLGW